MKTRLEKDALISPGDLDLVQLVDEPQEVIDLILEYRRRVSLPELPAKAFR
jgi:predicted Rossmann-fold nucleotide-binding protein